MEQQGSPISSFITLEQFSAIRLVQSVHQSLASLSKVIRGTSLLSPEVQKLANFSNARGQTDIPASVIKKLQETYYKILQGCCQLHLYHPGKSYCTQEYTVTHCC